MGSPEALAAGEHRARFRRMYAARARKHAQEVGSVRPDLLGNPKVDGGEFGADRPMEKSGDGNQERRVRLPKRKGFVAQSQERRFSPGRKASQVRGGSDGRVAQTRNHRAVGSGWRAHTAHARAVSDCLASDIVCHYLLLPYCKE